MRKKITSIKTAQTQTPETPINKGLEGVTPFPVSFVVIASQADMREYFTTLLESLPENCEVCVCVNMKGDVDGTTDISTHVVGSRTIRSITWTYTGDFNFSQARNYAHGIATNDWVMWMDCDEVIPAASHNAIGNVPVMVDSNVGGVMCGQASLNLISHWYEGKPEDSCDYVVYGQARIYRRGIAQWTGRVHEQLAIPIQQAGYRLISSSIIITHNGYSESKEKIKNKIMRNVKLLVEEVAARGIDGSDLSQYYTEVLHRELSACVKYEFFKLKNN